MAAERQSGSAHDTPADFGGRLLHWYDRHGRKDLPWQQQPTPYRVWVSEVMLQQTQVGTVIPYYRRFMARFPDAVRLAAGPLDEVLHHWTGLGYYARARNLFRAAGIIVREHGGELPGGLEALQALPGIGRSTAAAILSLSRDEPHAILDGNAKRVLCRYFAVAGWPGRPAVQRELWALAESLVPPRRAAAYTQAIMDLGATVCTRARPGCGVCPLAADCQAHQAGRPGDYPAPRPAKALPRRAVRFIMIRNPRGEVLLQRRPPAGVWGGLWGFPEAGADEPLPQWFQRHLYRVPAEYREWPPFRHTFSHFHLDITPVYACLPDTPPAVMEGAECVWYNPALPDARGLAQPVKRLLEQLSLSPG